MTIPTYLPYFVVTGTAATLVAILYGLTQDPTRALLVSAAILVGWLAVAISLSAAGVYHVNSSGIPTIQYGILLPILIGALMIWRSEATKRILEAVPQSWIVGVQLYRALGVIFADRLLSEPPLDDAERHLLWTLGKTAALASVARLVAKKAEEADQLEQRIDLAREIHEGVIQRLFGISMALDGDGDLPAEARLRCATETQEALSDLRSALQRPLGRAPRATQTTFVAEVERLARVHPDLGVTFAAGGEGDVPHWLEPLAQSVLAEAVRNAHKHAKPTRVTVDIGRSDRAFVLEVANDGVTGSGHRAGMGLRLAAMEALQFGGVVEFGQREPGTWQVRLVVPDEI